MTLKLPECERKRQGKFVRRAEKRGLLRKMTHLCRLSRTLFAGLVEVDTARGTKALDQQAKSGELGIKRQDTWRISVLYCNIAGHYVMGMWSLFTVTT